MDSRSIGISNSDRRPAVSIIIIIVNNMLQATNKIIEQAVLEVELHIAWKEISFS